MAETRKLFYEDGFRTRFDAVVTGTGRDQTGSYVLLDQTLFFPEGGGQPADQGRIKDCRIYDVQETENEIRHYIAEKKPDAARVARSIRSGKTVEGRSARPDAPLAACPFQAGDVVEGVIDWDRRFDLMQQHSGEHIVSGFIHARFGYDNVGFHMGERFITIDLNGEIDSRQLEEIEEEVNRYIWKDAETRAFFASDEEIRTLPYRSKLDLDEEVRLVAFPGADLCACCGLHVKTTGQIGLVKLVSVHRFRQGVRIEMLSGKRAYDYMNEHCRQNSRIAVELSAKPDNTFEAVTRLKEENYQLKGDIIRLEKEKYERIADQIRGKGDAAVFVKGLSPAEIRKCADEILNTCGGVCVLLSGDDDQGYRYAAGVRDGDIRDLVKEMNTQLDGRGGGKPEFCQGTLQAKQEMIHRFFQEKGYVLS